MKSIGLLWRTFLSTWEGLKVCSWSLEKVLSYGLRDTLIQTLCLILMVEGLHQSVRFYAMVVWLAGRFQTAHHCRFNHKSWVYYHPESCKESLLLQIICCRAWSVAIRCHLLYHDNNDTIALAKEPRSHQKSKHIKRRFNIIRDYLKKKYIEVRRVDSMDNIADPLTSNWASKKLKPTLRRWDLDIWPTGFRSSERLLGVWSEKSIVGWYILFF